MSNFNNEYLQNKEKKGISYLIRASVGVLFAIFFLEVIVAILNAMDFPDKGILWLCILAAIWGMAFSALGVYENAKSAINRHKFIKSTTGKNNILVIGGLLCATIVLITSANFSVINTREMMTDYIDGIEIPYLFSEESDDTDIVGSISSNDDIITIEANGVCFKMVLVNKGSFKMGATSDQQIYSDRDEYPEHEVSINNDFYIGQTEVTQELWVAIMEYNPSENIGIKKPVETVSWEDCHQFISKLNRITGRHFRLPTENEWEYAARGGAKGNGFLYSGSNRVEDVAWFGNNSGKATHDVACKQANELGLYDMSGNVYEWCENLYEPYCGTSIPDMNKSGQERVRRGGGCRYESKQCRVSFRGNSDYFTRRKDIGLRLVMDK